MQQAANTLITEIEPKTDSHSYEEIDKLALLKNDILHKMEMIDSLNLTFKQKSQTSFLKTFQKIMNDLSQQLKAAVEAYQNIDQEIQTDPKCVMLSQKAHFYQSQREVLQKQYEQQLFRLNEIKSKNQQLKIKRSKLRAKSVLSQQKIVKYIDKSNTLTMRFGHLVEDYHEKTEVNHKKVTESTKFYTSGGDKTRIPSFNSVNRKTFFENLEVDEEKNSRGKATLSRKRFTKGLTSNNATPFRLNNFF